jgi:hypothetical protein
MKSVFTFFSIVLFSLFISCGKKSSPPPEPSYNSILVNGLTVNNIPGFTNGTISAFYVKIYGGNGALLSTATPRQVTTLGLPTQIEFFNNSTFSYSVKTYIVKYMKLDNAGAEQEISSITLNASSYGKDPRELFFNSSGMIGTLRLDYLQ